MATMDSATEATRVTLETILTAGMFAAGMAWIAHVAVAGQCLWTILRKRDQQALYWLWVVCPLFGFATMNIFGYYDYYVHAFIKERQAYLGGPLAFWADNQSHPSAVGAFVGRLAAFTLGWTVILYRYYSLQAKHWYIRVTSFVLLLTTCVVVRKDIQRFLNSLTSPPTWENTLAVTDADFMGLYRAFLIALFSCIAVVVLNGSPRPFALETLEPENKALGFQYAVILVTAAPMFAWSVAGLVPAVLGIWIQSARSAQFVFMTVGVQLTAMCTELLISWIVEPPKDVREALRGAEEDNDDAVLIRI